MSVLSAETRGRLQEELAALEDERARLLELVAGTEGKDPADQAERTMREFDVEQLDVRIRRMVDRIDAANKPQAETPHDGTVREGEVVLLDFGDGTPERYVVGALAEVDDDVDAVTPSSPLGHCWPGLPERASLTRLRPASGPCASSVSAMSRTRRPKPANFFWYEPFPVDLDVIGPFCRGMWRHNLKIAAGTSRSVRVFGQCTSTRLPSVSSPRIAIGR